MALLLTKLAALFLNFGSMGGLFYDEAKFKNYASFKWLAPIAKFLDDALIPVVIVVGALGAIWIIILGVNLARAESSDKATEAKKRLINVVIAIVSVIILVFLLALFVSKVPDLFGSNDNNIFDGNQGQ